MTVKEYCHYFRNAVEAKPLVVGVGTGNDHKSVEVLTRNEALLLTKLPSSRRGRQPKSAGFFSAINQPYKSFGSLPDSHVFEWLARSFEIKPPKNMFYSRQPVSWKQKESAHSTTPLIKVSIMRNNRQRGTTQPIQLLRAGMSTLQLHLLAMEKSTQGTRIGMPYNCTVIGVYGTEKKADKELVAHRAEDHTVTSAIMASFAASRFKRVLERSTVKRNILQSEEDYLCKLEVIIRILYFLHNVKSKDLKGKLPLQASVMDHLCAHIPPFFKERNSLESSHGTRQQPIKSPHEVHTHEKKTPNLFESRIPPWHMQIVYIDEREEDRETMETRLKSCYDRFRQLKIDYSWKMREEIEERTRHSSRLLQIKLNELKFGPNPIRQFNLMREKASLIVEQEKKEQDNKPRWFIILQRVANSTLRTDKAQSKGQLYLEKLDFFTTSDVNAIHHVLEKFCLYFMSTPAHHICTTSAIEAIKFILEKMLNVSSKLCKQWLELRGLPWQQYFY